MSTTEANQFSVWGPRDYVQLPAIPDHWRVLDIGPGAYPLVRANAYLDRDINILEAIDLQPGQRLLRDSLEYGLPTIADNSYDFVWASHVLEHVVEIETAVNALNRISKRGCVVVPSFAKDALLHFQEREHFWLCLPNATHGEPIVFVEHNHGFLERLRDPLAQQATSFLYQTGSQHDCTAEQYMRAWWQKNERHLDLVSFWDEANPLKVIAIR